MRYVGAPVALQTDIADRVGMEDDHGRWLGLTADGEGSHEI